MELEPIPPFPMPLHDDPNFPEDPRLVRAQLASTIRYAEAILRRLEQQDLSTPAPTDASDDALPEELIKELDRELSEAFKEAEEETADVDEGEEQAAAKTRAPLTFSAEPVTEDEVEDLDSEVAGIANSSVFLEFKDGGYTSKFQPNRTPGLALPS